MTRGLLLAGLALPLGWGCNLLTGVSELEIASCVPNETRTCACAGNRSGVEVCTGESAWTSGCDCEQDTAALTPRDTERQEAVCPPDMHACDDGCQSNSSLDSCGSSCSPCLAPQNGMPSCDGVSCDFSCRTGYHRCGDECLSDRSPETCGTACTPCPEPVGGIATCDGIECGASCEPEYFEAEGDCHVDAMQLGLGARHSCAALLDGTLRCWGSNDYGELGDGTLVRSPVPVQVLSSRLVVQVAAGLSFTCSLLVDGSVECWGGNDRGQLGNGTTTNSPTPQPVVGVSNATGIAVGVDHACAVLADGSIRCWGANEYGQLGSETLGMDSPAPLVVTGLRARAVDLGAGGLATCALLEDTTVQCWGGGGVGALAEADGGVVGVHLGVTHACALLSAGTVACWGSNTYGELGFESSVAETSATPYLIAELTSVTALATGFGYGCAVEFGFVRCWGNNRLGQLGDGEGINTVTPGFVRGLNGVSAVAARTDHACAIVADGSVRCWGTNLNGELGMGLYSIQAPTPLNVLGW